MVALKRCGRWESQEKWRRHSAAVCSTERDPPIDSVPDSGSTNRSRVASTVDLPEPDGPVSATLSPGATRSENDASAGRSRCS